MKVSDNVNTYTLRARSARGIADSVRQHILDYDWGKVALLGDGCRYFILDGDSCRESGETQEWLDLWILQ